MFFFCGESLRNLIPAIPEVGLRDEKLLNVVFFTRFSHIFSHNCAIIT